MEPKSPKIMEGMPERVSVANSMALFMMTLRYSSPIAGNGAVVALHEEEIGDLASIFEHIAEGRFLVAVGNTLHESRG